LYRKRGGELRFKLGDFGLARAFPSAGRIGTAAGTYQYGAPEVLNGQRYTEKADMWGAGCILYELFTGSVYYDDCRRSGGQHELGNEKLNSFKKSGIIPKWLEVQQTLCQVRGDRMTAQELVTVARSQKYVV
jgi:serine/threonine protein kinase